MDLDVRRGGFGMLRRHRLWSLIGLLLSPVLAADSHAASSSRSTIKRVAVAYMRTFGRADAPSGFQELCARAPDICRYGAGRERDRTDRCWLARPRRGQPIGQLINRRSQRCRHLWPNRVLEPAAVDWRLRGLRAAQAQTAHRARLDRRLVAADRRQGRGRRRPCGVDRPYQQGRFPARQSPRGGPAVERGPLHLRQAAVVPRSDVVDVAAGEGRRRPGMRCRATASITFSRPTATELRRGLTQR